MDKQRWHHTCSETYHSRQLLVNIKIVKVLLNIKTIKLWLKILMGMIPTMQNYRWVHFLMGTVQGGTLHTLSVAVCD